jgi:PAS domain S-box-containing protein
MPHRLQDVDLWLVDSLVVPASLHDVEGRFVHMNAAAERASGNSNAQVLGRHFTDSLPSEARKKVEAQFRRAAELGEPTDFETVFVDASGQLRGVRAQVDGAHLESTASTSCRLAGIMRLSTSHRSTSCKEYDMAPTSWTTSS